MPTQIQGAYMKSTYESDILSEHTSKTQIPEATSCHRAYSEHA